MILSTAFHIQIFNPNGDTDERLGRVSTSAL